VRPPALHLAKCAHPAAAPPALQLGAIVASTGDSWTFGATASSPTPSRNAMPRQDEATVRAAAAGHSSFPVSARCRGASDVVVMLVLMLEQ
jgi:hypothetical protein